MLCEFSISIMQRLVGHDAGAVISKICVLYLQPVRWPIIVIIIVRWSVCLCIWLDGPDIDVVLWLVTSNIHIQVGFVRPVLVCKIMDYTAKYGCISMGSTNMHMYKYYAI